MNWIKGLLDWKHCGTWMFAEKFWQYRQIAPKPLELTLAIWCSTGGDLQIFWALLALTVTKYQNHYSAINFLPWMSSSQTISGLSLDQLNFTPYKSVYLHSRIVIAGLHSVLWECISTASSKGRSKGYGNIKTVKCASVIPGSAEYLAVQGHGTEERPAALQFHLKRPYWKTWVAKRSNQSNFLKRNCKDPQRYRFMGALYTRNC